MYFESFTIISFLMMDWPQYDIYQKFQLWITFEDFKNETCLISDEIYSSLMTNTTLNVDVRLQWWKFFKANRIPTRLQ